MKLAGETHPGLPELSPSKSSINSITSFLSKLGRSSHFSQFRHILPIQRPLYTFSSTIEIVSYHTTGAKRTQTAPRIIACYSYCSVVAFQVAKQLKTIGNKIKFIARLMCPTYYGLSDHSLFASERSRGSKSSTSWTLLDFSTSAERTTMRQVLFKHGLLV
ncbi:uncharacterized protein EDB93DRAFT_1119879 [Suillus bovinus]|uniref:uncharacterized protein n=1 Tax=Suillus bovinus TaxID=48563 RepID=UPI001B88080D|nr:uncharacterized protein EDB93DRAFT_1119879 [Suillus bovinus]KAG2158705.1 hypothetical protein EDB93DRAFT_1119879 [Suillus bovinus]